MMTSGMHRRPFEGRHLVFTCFMFQFAINLNFFSDGFSSLFPGGPSGFSGNRPPHFGGPYDRNDFGGLSNGARMPGSMGPHSIRPDNFMGINMVATNGPGKLKGFFRHIFILKV